MCVVCLSACLTIIINFVVYFFCLTLANKQRENLELIEFLVSFFTYHNDIVIEDFKTLKLAKYAQDNIYLVSCFSGG